MELAAAWAPSEFQLENWTVEEEPAAGHHLEYASIDNIFNTCYLQPYVLPESSVAQQQQQQLVEYYNYSSASEHTLPSHEAEVTEIIPADGLELAECTSDDAVISRANCVVKKVVDGLEADIKLMKKKMHKYPASLGALDKFYTLPRFVAIGPYHHGKCHLKQAEKLKHAAACHFIQRSGCMLKKLYEAVVPVADKARRLYDKDVMAEIGVEDFRHMMFFDACFLVQYMAMQSNTEVDENLRGFLGPNRIDILHDVMLLENQLPWKVVKTVMRFTNEPLPFLFVTMLRGCLQDQKLPKDKRPRVSWDESFKPPHLLGLLRYYIVGRRRSNCSNSNRAYGGDTKKPKKRSVSASAVELAEIGIKLTANKETTELIYMGLDQEGTLFAELSMVPLSLNRDRASYLVNMAALELCTVQSFGKAPEEDSAVCSYLLLLGMLVCREEDVQELRQSGLLQGGGGLTNQEALSFFTSLQDLRLGSCYSRILEQIERYKENRWIKTKMYTFFYKNWKFIVGVGTGLGALGGIIGMLDSIKRAL